MKSFGDVIYNMCIFYSLMWCYMRGVGRACLAPMKQGFVGNTAWIQSLSEIVAFNDNSLNVSRLGRVREILSAEKKEEVLIICYTNLKICLTTCQIEPI